MTKLLRIFQLTILAIVFMVVCGVASFLIEAWSGGRLQQLRNAPFAGRVGDGFLGIELAVLPFVLAVLACWGVVKLFRLRAVYNEVNSTFRPILSLFSGYVRFVFVVVAVIHLLMGHGWAAAAHFAIAVVMFALFYLRHSAREKAIHDRFQLREDEEGDDAREHDEWRSK